ncbi:MAG: hypothetical protein G01um101448_669 [Parcubacteria group bacterium Gr01-1014_48]|nr:MAG: hypothetical protein Greene041614_766 [Parcubacteria group bacterium Greene0416_14]TSC73618.1 MAG: hypothetical protein G01um101448_669 [Parcubacteria group bacterium Gr01-1014_48]TSD00896.1 MAG: hypothetical protein Greene101415_610 [Parcubacteria group bacterium Greene1014_15]TSD07977.1 MAG: hypothetical protein Greene07144_518 [Parcubacteria group bacterium Greene0714_4]
MIGKVTRDLLKAGKFPWCLNETFADRRSGGGGLASPYKQYLRRQTYQKSIFFGVLLVSICSFIGLNFEGNSEITTLMRVGSTVFCLFLFLMWFVLCFEQGTRTFKDDICTFEESLSQVINNLECSSISPSRNIELMTANEVKWLSHDIITQCTYDILVSERDEGPGCQTSENLRVRLKKVFDLFKTYGLIATSETYQPFYEEAKKRIEVSLVGTEHGITKMG